MEFQAMEFQVFFLGGVAFLAFGIVFWLFYRPSSSPPSPPESEPEASDFPNSPEALERLREELAGDEEYLEAEEVYLDAEEIKELVDKHELNAEPSESFSRKGEWLRPEVLVGTRVVVYAPPTSRRPEDKVGIGEVVSRGNRRGRVDWTKLFKDPGSSNRRTVNNMVIAGNKRTRKAHAYGVR